VQAEEALSQQELEATIRLSKAQAELQEAGNKVLAGRMQRQSDADIIRNLSHAKELDRRQHIQRLRGTELNEARQFENANRKYEDMRQELANDKANSIHSVEMKAESYYAAFKNESDAKANAADLKIEQLSRMCEDEVRAMGMRQENVASNMRSNSRSDCKVYRASQGSKRINSLKRCRQI